MNCWRLNSWVLHLSGVPCTVMGFYTKNLIKNPRNSIRRKGKVIIIKYIQNTLHNKSLFFGGMGRTYQRFIQPRDSTFFPLLPALAFLFHIRGEKHTQQGQCLKEIDWECYCQFREQGEKRGKIYHYRYNCGDTVPLRHRIPT